MKCPACDADGISFWRLWLLNLRQQIRCLQCGTEFSIETPGRIAVGTVVLLLASAASYFSAGGSGLGLVLLLLAIVLNFVLTHHYAQLSRLDDKP